MEERLLEMTGGGVFCRRRYEGAAAREASSDDDVGGVPSSQCRRLTRIGGYRLVTTWRREPQVATMEERMLETMDGAVSSEDDLANGDEECGALYLGWQTNSLWEKRPGKSLQWQTERCDRRRAWSAGNPIIMNCIGSQRIPCTENVTSSNF
jgi:hypothetical protein